MKELWSSLERNMQTRNCFLHLGNLKKIAKRYYIDAATRMILEGHITIEHYSSKNVQFSHWFIPQHDRVRVIFQYALQILPKEECQVSAEILFCNLW